jgi:large subunit ribosomal protein L4
MPKVDILNTENKVVAKLDLNEQVFDAHVNEHLVHQAVRVQLARRRAGTACTKNRALVSGSRKKPWRQKGTGRARAGSRQSPLWRGGGVVFGPSPREFRIKLNRKVRKAALRAVLTQKLREGNLKVLDQLELPEIQTRKMAEILEKLRLKSALIVIAGHDEVAQKSARNIPNVKVTTVDGLNVYDVLRHQDL